MRDVDLKRRMVLAGLEVIEVLGWEERGADSLTGRGSVHHHTAGPRTGVAPSLGTCINGRGGANPLAGPLANTYGSREERMAVHLIAAGRANHAGAGGWQGLAGNSSVYGHEEEHVGTTAEPAPSPLRIERMVRVHAAFAFERFDPAVFTCQHHEWTSRKIDFVRAYIDPDEFRARVAERVELMMQPTPTPEDPEMFKIIATTHPDAGDLAGAWWLTNGAWRKWVPNQAHANRLVALGLAEAVDSDGNGNVEPELVGPGFIRDLDPFRPGDNGPLEYAERYPPLPGS